MSYLTSCNFCTLRSLEERYGKKKLAITKIGKDNLDWPEGWVQVDLIGWGGRKTFLCVFMELSDHCVC